MALTTVIVVTDTDLSNFQASLQANLKSGFTFQGNLVVILDGSSTPPIPTFYQMMVQ